MSYKYTTKVATRFSVFSQKSWQIWQKHPFCQKTDKNRCKKNLCTAFTEVKQKGNIENKNRNCIPAGIHSWVQRNLERATRLELATSTLARWRSTGWATPAYKKLGANSRDFSWCPRSESNQRHADFQSAALPTELQGHKKALLTTVVGTTGLEPVTLCL